MISKKHFKTLVYEYFQYLVDDLNFNEPEISSNGNIFFDIEYKNENRVISISYEVIEDYLQTIITSKAKKLPSIKNTPKNINLKTLRPLIIPKLNKMRFIKCNQEYKEYTEYTRTGAFKKA